MDYLEHIFRYWSPDSLFGFIFWGGLIHVLTYLIAYAIDRFIHGPFQGSPSSAQQSLRHDLMCIGLELFNTRKALGNILTLGSVAWMLDISHSYRDSRLIESSALAFVAYLVVFDFLLYWYHRLSHLHPLWIQHEYHHSATELNPLSDLRIHALSYPFLFILVVWPISLTFGLSKVQILSFNWIANILSILAHSRWNTGYGWIGRWLLVSPRHHRLHHSRSADQHSNFATYLVIWDRLFGTYRESTHAFEMPTGVDSNHFSKPGESPLIAYLKVYPRFFRALWKLLTPTRQDQPCPRTLG